MKVSRKFYFRRLPSLLKILKKLLLLFSYRDVLFIVVIGLKVKKMEEIKSD